MSKIVLPILLLVFISMIFIGLTLSQGLPFALMATGGIGVFAILIIWVEGGIRQ